MFQWRERAARQGSRSAGGCVAAPDGALFPPDQEGAAAVEFALLLPLLAMIFVGAVDAASFATASYRSRMLAQSAATAIARMPAVPAPPPVQRLPNGSVVIPVPVRLPTIDVGSLVDLPPGATAEAYLFWGCSGSAGIEEVPLPACADGSPAAAYVRVGIALPVGHLVAWAGIGLPETAATETLVRLG
jgi:hypothetical protein